MLCSRDCLIAELVHRPELPGGVDMQQRKWRRRRVERLESKVQHDRAVFAGRVEHDRSLTLRDGLAKNVDALGFEPLQVGQRLHPNDSRPYALFHL